MATKKKPSRKAIGPVLGDAIAGLLGLPQSRVNLKATTTEHLGFVGRSEGLMAMATVLIDER